MKTVIIIQARVGSSRLPGKVLMPIAGKTLLERMAERVRAARQADEIVIATTVEPEDDPIEEIAVRNGYRVFRGHPTDLLDRHYKAAKEHDADIVVKIPSDCPLIDPRIIDKTIIHYKRFSDLFDYVSNLHPASYPDGNDVEVMPIQILKEAWTEATKDYEREHTTPFIWENPERYRIGNVIWEHGFDYSMSHRFTIDYKEDYYFIKRVYDELWHEGMPIFTLADILALLEAQPQIQFINSKYAGVNWYRNHLDDLRTIGGHQTRLLIF